MAHNRTTQYSAPYRRNNLMSLQQYVASADFPTLGMWDRARSDDLYVIKNTVGRSQPVHITVVGVISSDRTHLEPHGNYSPSYMAQDEIGKKAKVQFVISNPVDDPDFSADYITGLRRLSAIQEEIAASPSKRDHFIVETNNIRLTCNLFEPKTAEELEAALSEESDDVENASDREESDENDLSEDERERRRKLPNYQVAQEYKEAWAETEKTYHNNIMQVYGLDELLVDYRQFSKVLVSGTTVAVSFILRHYAIRNKDTRLIASDTYSAVVKTVSILKEAAKKVRTTPHSTPKRRPLPVSQTPSRVTLGQAADTFSPIRMPGGLAPATSSSRSKSDARSQAASDSAESVSSKTAVRLPQFVEGSSRQAPSDSGIKANLSPEVIAMLLPYILDKLNDPALPIASLLGHTLATQPSVDTDTPAAGKPPAEDDGNDNGSTDSTISTEATAAAMENNEGATGTAEPRTGTMSDSTLSSAGSIHDDASREPDNSARISGSVVETVPEGTNIQHDKSSSASAGVGESSGNRKAPGSKVPAAKVNVATDIPLEKKESKRRRVT